MPNGLDVLASGPKSAAGDSGIKGGYGATKTLRVQLNVTAVTGVAPTLDVVLEDTIDGTNFNVVGTFAQKTASGREVINITTPYTDSIRARWSVGGTTPSFDFTVRVYSE